MNAVDQTAGRWAQLRARDPNATFFYSVATTGVVCRPSCAARPARPENIAFHDTLEEAERAGFRPCKRCKPKEAPLAERNAAKIAELCRFIDACDETPTLAMLAEHAQTSAFHLHRLFKSVTGLTPRAYAAARRSARMRGELGTTKSVTEAIYSAGFGSSARFYEKAGERLGMTPSAYRAGGKDEVIRFALAECSLGSILIAATTRGVCAISFGDEPEPLVRELEERFPRATLIGADAAFEKTVATVLAFVEDPRKTPRLPLDIRGTAFQERVWKALANIPAGKTLTYAEVAEKIGSPRATRAVANACGANMLAVVVPCHRVVPKGGAGQGGYRWGVERKRALIARERLPPKVSARSASGR